MRVVIFLLNAARALVVIDALLSWLQKPNEFPRNVTKPLLDPIYAPVRSLLAKVVPSVDLAPLVALLVLYVVQKALESGRAQRS